MPFSIFPSTYRDEKDPEVTSETHEQVEVNLPNKQPAGREGQYSSFTAAELPPRGDRRHSEEEVRITREEERYRRPGFEQHIHEHR